MSPDEVTLILKSLPVGKATGPDGLSNRILSVLADELSIPVCALFNESLQHGTVPDCFKETHVCPILKGGDPSVPSNYIPISLLSNLDKASERLVLNIYTITSLLTISLHRSSLALDQATLLLINLHIYTILSATR